VIRIDEATGSDAVGAARRLLREYQAAIGVDLGFQDFDAELAGLPGAYAPPRGRLLLGRCDGVLAGCVALRPLSTDVCEMKRLYVRQDHRATGFGRVLAARVIEDARAIGYKRMCLDTLPTMAQAQKLYASLGFKDIAPYRHNPIAGTRFLGIDL